MILEVIKQNPVKIFFIFMITLSCYGIYTGELLPKTQEVLSTTFVNGEYIHILDNGKTKHTKTPLEVEGVYTWKDPDGFIIMGVLGVLCFGALLFFATILPDDEMNWNLWDCRYANLKNQVELSKEGNTYHYFLKGKLLISSDHSLHPREIPIRPYMSNKKILEDYVPTKKKRKIILKDLLNI